MDDLNFIHRYVPPQNDSKRILLLLHGTGGDEADLLPLGRELDPDAALLSPRGKVLENGAPRFFRRFAEGVFDEQDAISRANELAHFVTAAANRYQFDLEKLVAVGYSNGANVAAVAILLRPESIRSAILFRAMVVLTSPPKTDLRGHRVLISAGSHDPIIPLENAERLKALLQERGAELVFEVQPASHALVRGDLSAGQSFLRFAGPSGRDR